MKRVLSAALCLLLVAWPAFAQQPTGIGGVLAPPGSGGGGSGSVTSITPGAGQVSSTTAACSQTAITSSGTLSTSECLDAQVGTTYAIPDSDRGKLITATNTSSQAYSIAQAGAGTTFQAGWFARIQNGSTGIVIVTPTTSTICGAATLTIYPGQTYKVTSDGTNYQCDGGTTGNIAVSSQAGSNYPFVSSNFAQLVNLTNATNQIPTIPQAGTAGFPAGWYTEACNLGTGTQTITPTTSLIGGATTFVLPAGTTTAPTCVTVISDGTNYQVVPDFIRAGTNVLTALANALSSAGGVTSTIASGTAVLGTSAIASATCASVVQSTATNVISTDALQWSFNSSPIAVTGYVPSTSGTLNIVSYPSSGNANFLVCNNTSGSITPGAITLNWRVVR